MIRETIRVLAPVLLVLSVISSKATAATVTYDLELNNLSQFTGQTLARVTLTDIAGGGVDFTVEALLAGSRLNQFGFNFLSNTEPFGFSITGLPSVWGYSVAIDAQGGFNGFGKFDVDVKDGGNNGRLNPLTFSVSVGTVEDYVAFSDKGAEPSLFSAHATNLNINGSGSCSAEDVTGGICKAITGYAGGGTLVPPAEIPLPAAVWLFGSGLIGIAGMGWRKKST